MQRSLPRVPRQQPAGHPADPETRLTVELASVVASARRRAARDGDRQVDTAHLLHSLVESDPEVRAAFPSGTQVARVLGYLVQRSIGYGLRWRGRVEPHPESCRPAEAVAGWSPAAVAAMEGARARAEGRGDPRVRGLDLLAELAAHPGSRAVDVLSHAGVDPLSLTAPAAPPSQQVSRPLRS
ncbi:Clp protease N-terminal domain-containing protein [Streptomyces coeruleoprunus]|uniref:Clp protease N-terminal domain-containing protein n=1 Tax=Streptomyces coeruleoprunus TaxID=285563 RepID=A0ABV9XL63_9ACTN